MKYVPPSVRDTAFNCPHCGALAKQDWLIVLAKDKTRAKPLPVLINSENRETFDFAHIEDTTRRAELDEWADRMARGRPFLGTENATAYGPKHLFNMSLSRCFNCNDISIWIFDKLIYPQRGEAPPANADLSPEIKRDYDEASTILDLSPRGAAALIRLAIQKLCKELGQPGDNINSDIGALVAAGLDGRIQKLLDVVRVVGNNAVHPGQIDLRDDRATAEILFHLINLIAEKMISEPKHVDEVYATLPQEALSAIQKRDDKD